MKVSNLAAERSPERLEACDGDHASLAAGGPAPARLLAEPRALARAAGLFRAAGDIERLRILERLAEREWCVTELALALGDPLSTVSQRLRVLRAEGLVARRRAGKHIHYGLIDHHLKDLILTALAHASHEARGAPSLSPTDPEQT